MERNGNENERSSFLYFRPSFPFVSLPFPVLPGKGHSSFPFVSSPFAADTVRFQFPCLYMGNGKRGHIWAGKKAKMNKPKTNPHRDKSALAKRLPQDTFDRESIRLLAIELGLRGAARRCGISEGTVRCWSHRYHWNVPRRAGRPPLNLATNLKTKPGDVLLEELGCHEKQTKLNLARTGTKLSAEAAATGSLKDARSALDIARMSGLLYNWKSADPQINIEHSNVILTKADILELQELHRKALLAGK
jgi:hypothetical protein